MLVGMCWIRRTKRDRKCRYKPCPHEGVIRSGEPYVSIMRKSRDFKSGKTFRWYKGLHMDCFPLWASYVNTNREEYLASQPGGRPVGSGQLRSLTDTEREQRRSLVRKRARTLLAFKVASDVDAKALWEVVLELEKLIKATGVPLQRAMQSHRSDRDLIRKKATRLVLS